MSQLCTEHGTGAVVISVQPGLEMHNWVHNLLLAVASDCLNDSVLALHIIYSIYS